MGISNEMALEFTADGRQCEILWNSRDKEFKNNRKKRDISPLLLEKCYSSVSYLGKGKN
jgi:hypothetical protein